MKKKIVQKNDGNWKWKVELELTEWACLGVVVLTVAFMISLLLQILRG